MVQFSPSCLPFLLALTRWLLYKFILNTIFCQVSHIKDIVTVSGIMLNIQHIEKHLNHKLYINEVLCFMLCPTYHHLQEQTPLENILVAQKLF
jgi:hypothetical protein